MNSQTSLSKRLAAMPKAEIHVHIEGATAPQTYYTIAQRRGLKLPVDSPEAWERFFEFKNFNHFIEVYITSVGLLSRTEDYALLIEDFFKVQASQNIRYTEAFLSASFLTQKFETPVILDAIERGLSRGENRYGVKVALIPDISRESPDTQGPVLDFVLEGHRRGLFIGLGLGGIEDGFPPSLFTQTFEKARAKGLHVVAHAGEAAGAPSVWGALNDLHAERIGHGVRSLEDPKLIAHLKETQIPLEVSPVSNYRLGIVAPSQPHPIRQLFEAGVNVTVNSDDPAMFSTSLTREYELLADQGFSFEQLWQLNLQTLRASFLPIEEKKRLEADFQHALSQL